LRVFGSSSKLGRGARFERALAAELRPKPLGVVAHMAPIFAVLAAPLVRPRRVPLVLWYTHWHASPTLRLAERVVSAVTSVDRRSFPLPSAKVRAIGHGIDLREFPCVGPRKEDRLRLLALGRYSRAKGLDVIVRALAGADVDAELVVHGPTLNDAEIDHLAELGRLVRDLGVDDRVRLGAPVPRADVPRLLARADALVNNMRAGALDKVVYEAAAAARPVLVASPGFESLVGGLEPPLRFSQDDARELASRIRALHDSGPEARRSLGRELRERVRRGHSVEHWAEGVIAAISK
jgi:glycosyltransferase involved in cell wall biosynthesis